MALRCVNDGNGILFGSIRQKDIVDSVLKRPITTQISYFAIELKLLDLKLPILFFSFVIQTRTDCQTYSNTNWNTQGNIFEHQTKW